jgi:hypothetical protein
LNRYTLGLSTSIIGIKAIHAKHGSIGRIRDGTNRSYDSM